ncbi:hypothetical protein [Salegentibacter sp. UBA1130]|uniref:hypothetical protein n=1 Tax=Salegentibacter sp. UBA1130 TaxID=1947451 RepID=UPI00257A4F2C|nr:hypothetical protein [Salegentibacter sp. UBA1130]
MKIFSYLLLFISLQTYGQEVKGYLYNANGRIDHNITVKNITQQLNSTSDGNGFFKISANVQDTIVFKSILYEEENLIIERNHLTNNIVIELKNTTLDEVKIRNRNFKTVPIEKLDEKLYYSLQQDILKNPTFYEPHKGNIIYLLQAVKGLLSKKKEARKTDLPNQKMISYNELKILFKKDDILNKQFLLENLSIPKSYHPLFLDFLVSKKINSNLLQEKKKLDLINLIYNAGKEYREINQL